MRVRAVSTLCFPSATSLSAFSASLFKQRTFLTIPLLAIVYSTLGLTSIVKEPAVALLRMAFAAMPVQRTSARQAAMIPSLAQPGFLLVFASLSASAMSSSLIFPIERRRTSVFIA